MRNLHDEAIPEVPKLLQLTHPLEVFHEIHSPLYPNKFKETDLA
jgi:hypothetical protein